MGRKDAAGNNPAGELRITPDDVTQPAFDNLERRFLRTAQFVQQELDIFASDRVVDL